MNHGIVSSVPVLGSNKLGKFSSYFQLAEAYKSPVEADHAYNCSLGLVLPVGAV
jgi:hypothetical protein